MALKQWGLKDLNLKVDQEGPIISLAREVAGRHEYKVQVVHGPRYSHASMGHIERANLEVERQMRALQIQFEDHTKEKM
eukprot:3606233-Amphidinium_carterae.1